MDRREEIRQAKVLGTHTFMEREGPSFFPSGSVWFKCSCGTSGHLSNTPHEDWLKHIHQVHLEVHEIKLHNAASKMYTVLKDIANGGYHSDYTAELAQEAIQDLHEDEVKGS